MPGRAKNMGDGWETKRKRALPGHDWVILKLGHPGIVQKILVDTNHFKGNYPDKCSLEFCNAPLANVDDFTSGTVIWHELLPATKLQAHKQHVFLKLAPEQSCTHVRMNIFPDGGISRLRLFGRAV